VALGRPTLTAGSRTSSVMEPTAYSIGQGLSCRLDSHFVNSPPPPPSHSAGSPPKHCNLVWRLAT
jgi:hypothetical protein